MIEKIIELEVADPTIFYGVNNSNIRLIKDLYPKVKIVARGTAIKIHGDEEEIALIEEVIGKLEKYCATYNKLTEEVIIDYIKGSDPKIQVENNLIIYGISGKPITARTPTQKKFMAAYEKNDLIFSIGPAGSGKTYIAIATAVRALKNKEVK